jgi:hypothetical protein
VFCSDLNLSEEAFGGLEARELQPHADLVLELDEEGWEAWLQKRTERLEALVAQRADAAEQLATLESNVPGEVLQAMAEADRIGRELQVADQAIAALERDASLTPPELQAAMVQAQYQRQGLERVFIQARQSTLPYERQNRQLMLERERLVTRIAALDEQIRELRSIVERGASRQPPETPSEALAVNRAEEDREVEVLQAVEDAFGTLAAAELQNATGYPEAMRTTLRSSIFQVFQVPTKQRYYAPTASIHDFTFSSYDQVLFRLTGDTRWEEPSLTLVHLLAAVLPASAPARKAVAFDRGGGGSATQSTLGFEQDAEIDAVLQEARSLGRKLGRAHAASTGGTSGSGGSGKSEASSSMETSGTLWMSGADDGAFPPPQPDPEPAWQMDPVPGLDQLLAEREVRKAALITAYKRFVKMNNEDEDIGIVRDRAAAAAETPDPVRAFFDDELVWKKETSTRGTLFQYATTSTSTSNVNSNSSPGTFMAQRERRAADDRINPARELNQEYTLFELSYYLAVANLLSNHLPLVGEIRVLPLPLQPRQPATLSMVPVEHPLDAEVLPCGLVVPRHPALCPNLNRCCGTCSEGTSLRASDGCLTGADLVRIGLEVVLSLIGRVQAMLTLDTLLKNGVLYVEQGSDWLVVAGHVIQNKEETFTVSHDTQYFKTQKYLSVGQEGTTVWIDPDPEANPYHPRVLFTNTGEKDDWPYSRIGKEGAGGPEPECAGGLLELLRTGLFPSGFLSGAEKTRLAALLTLMFIVEANKDNLCFLTGVLSLIGVRDGYYTFRQIFYDGDPGNEHGLCGRLGLFPLASTDGSTFEGRRHVLQLGGQPENDAQVMTACRNASSSTGATVMTRKDMLVIAEWCRRTIADHASVSMFQLRKRVRMELLELMVNTYR